MKLRHLLCAAGLAALLAGPGVSAAGAQLLPPAASRDAALKQQTGTPLGGGAQIGTQPIGGQTGAQAAGAPRSGSQTSGNQGTGSQGTGNQGSGNQAGTAQGSSIEATSAPITTDRALLFPAAQDQRLSYGDLIVIRLYGQADYNPTVRIGTDGKVLLPLIGLVDLQGQTITGAEELIARKLLDAGMYRDPQVTVQLLEGPSAFVTVVGEAHGLVPVTGSRRLFDIIAGAGGLPGTASHIVTINRPGQQPLVVDLGNDPSSSELANVPVFPGDTVIVGRLGVVYVVGEFKTQGAIGLTNGAPLTLLQATALSGGPIYDAKMDDLRLIRTVGDRRTIVRLDIQKVLYGKAPDPILQAGDIVYLPTSTVKQAIQSGGLGAVLSLVNLAITAVYLAR